MNRLSKPVLVICGPTSTGKTSLALDLAKETDAVVISADSRQIYKYMDIGTGKIPLNKQVSVKKHEDKWYLNGIEIHGYDLVEPSENYTAYDFYLYTRKLLNQFVNESRQVILVGGTGFYIDVVTGHIKLEGAPSNPQLRSELNILPLEVLQKKLQEISSTEFNRIDIKNKVRVIRSIEKHVLPENNEFITVPLNNIQFVQVGLTSSNEYMFNKADIWTDEIWSSLIIETKKLMEIGYSDTPPLNGLIYKTTKKFINNELNEAEAIQRIKFDIHAYIRRQMTWFKKNQNINWYDVFVLPYSQIKSDVLKQISV